MERAGVRIKSFVIRYKSSVAILFYLFLCACTNPKNEQTQNETYKQETKANKLPAPQFNSDSAFSFLEKQVKFGPRVPGTASHEKCANYLFEKLKSYRLTTSFQQETVTTFDNKIFRLKNIIAEYKPELSKRILLCAHWDTRPWADQDSVNKYKPFDGANDGASGGAVLVEIARLISASQLDVGVDIVLFDLEDYGQEQDDNRFPPQENTWCLGSQHWARNPHKANYYAEYGILLDMVGGKNPVFPREGTGYHYAPDIIEKVWSNAKNLGYGNFFIDAVGPQTTDDHLYVNQFANIKCIDIVHYEIDKRNYPYYHHTHGDNINVIDKNTLKMVGQVVLETLFSETVM